MKSSSFLGNVQGEFWRPRENCSICYVNFMFNYKKLNFLMTIATTAIVTIRCWVPSIDTTNVFFPHVKPVFRKIFVYHHHHHHHHSTQKCQVLKMPLGQTRCKASVTLYINSNKKKLIQVQYLKKMFALFHMFFTAGKHYFCLINNVFSLIFSIKYSLVIDSKLWFV